jgi:hypothetical protein
MWSKVDQLFGFFDTPAQHRRITPSLVLTLCVEDPKEPLSRGADRAIGDEPFPKLLQ